MQPFFSYDVTIPNGLVPTNGGSDATVSPLPAVGQFLTALFRLDMGTKERSRCAAHPGLGLSIHLFPIGAFAFAGCFIPSSV